MTNPLDLAAIEARCNAATGGPWRYSNDLKFATIRGAAREIICASANWKDGNLRENADFILSARADIPALIACVRELESERDALKAQVAEAVAKELARLPWIIEDEGKDQ